MGLIRLIILALVIWMFWRLVKNFQAKQAGKNSGKQHIENSNMVLCRYCSVHVPEKEAIHHEQLWFCSENHRDKFLSDNN